nr:psbp domain-containing protein 2, chloroplastic [Quercus suber]
MTTKPILAEELQLQRYIDPKEGFTLLRPSSWIKVDKAGATVLFEEANKGSNNVGVVVNPVRLTSLGEFGTPQFVAEKLIQAERRKESTNDAEVISVAERSGQGGSQVTPDIKSQHVSWNLHFFLSLLDLQKQRWKCSRMEVTFAGGFKWQKSIFCGIHQEKNHPLRI